MNSENLPKNQLNDFRKTMSCKKVKQIFPYHVPNKHLSPFSCSEMKMNFYQVHHQCTKTNSKTKESRMLLT